jgi:hypothetical protein
MIVMKETISTRQEVTPYRTRLGEHRPKERWTMKRSHASTLSLIVAGVLAAGVLGTAAQAQAPVRAPAAPSTASKPADGASAWTRKKWIEAKAKWSQEKEKWADCRRQSKDQKLSGRKSWSFIASCMTK